MSKLEDSPEAVMQSEEERKNEDEQFLRELWDTRKHGNTPIMDQTRREERKRSAEKYLKK